MNLRYVDLPCMLSQEFRTQIRSECGSEVETGPKGRQKVDLDGKIGLKGRREVDPDSKIGLKGRQKVDLDAKNGPKGRRKVDLDGKIGLKGRRKVDMDGKIGLRVVAGVRIESSVVESRMSVVKSRMPNGNLFLDTAMLCGYMAIQLYG